MTHQNTHRLLLRVAYLDQANLAISWISILDDSHLSLPFANQIYDDFDDFTGILPSREAAVD